MQSLIKKMFPQTCQQANLIEALSQLKFTIPPMNPACIKLINWLTKTTMFVNKQYENPVWENQNKERKKQTNNTKN